MPVDGIECGAGQADFEEPEADVEGKLVERLPFGIHAAGEAADTADQKRGSRAEPEHAGKCQDEAKGHGPRVFGGYLLKERDLFPAADDRQQRENKKLPDGRIGLLLPEERHEQTERNSGKTDTEYIDARRQWKLSH